MSEKYTEDDILAEAISMHSFSAGDLEDGYLFNLMEVSEVPSTKNDMGDVMTWRDLLGEDEDAFTEAAEKVSKLYNEAADTSEWAIDLGMEEMTPFSGHVDIAVGPSKARVLFAFTEDIPFEQQAKFVMGVTKKLSEEL